MKSHKIQSILTFIYIFLIPFTAVLYHCLLTTPAFQKHFPMETVQPYLSFFFNLLMVLCLLSFISIIITTCNNTKKTDWVEYAWFNTADSPETGKRNWNSANTDSWKAALYSVIFIRISILQLIYANLKTMMIWQLWFLPMWREIILILIVRMLY